MLEKQIQQQTAQMANLQKQMQQGAQGNQGNQEVLIKELDATRQEMQNATVERDRFQAQLEMLVQELEKSQVGALAYTKNDQIILFFVEIFYTFVINKIIILKFF